MTFLIEFDKQPLEFIKKSDKHIAKRILEKLEELFIFGPVPHTAKAIAGEHNVFRVRIGDYRAIYRIILGDTSFRTFVVSPVYTKDINYFPDIIMSFSIIAKAIRLLSLSLIKEQRFMSKFCLN